MQETPRLQLPRLPESLQRYFRRDLLREFIDSFFCQSDPPENRSDDRPRSDCVHADGRSASSAVAVRANDRNTALVAESALVPIDLGYRQ